MATKLIILILAIVLAIGLGFWFYQKAHAPSSDIGYQNKSAENSDIRYQSIDQVNNMQLSSPVFTTNTPLPAIYTCSGQNINPPLEISNVPAEAKCLVLVVDDPDAPGGSFIHWLVWNISPQTAVIGENSSLAGPVPSMPEGAVQGKNGFGEIGYSGPCPPNGRGEHHYVFKLYALDIMLDLPVGSDSQALGQLMVGHIISQSQLIGLFGRQ